MTEGDIRTWPLMGVPATATLPEAATMMSDRGISAVGVFDSHHELLGIITERDLTWTIAQGTDTSKVTVKQVLNDFPVILESPVSREDVADAMRKSHIRHVIVKEDGKDYRIRSMRDLVEESDIAFSERKSPVEGSFHGAPDFVPARTPVRKIMTRPVVVCYEQDDLEVIARMLTDREVSGLPVLDPAGKVVGVVSENDVAKALGAPLLRLALHPQESGPFLRETQVPGPHTAADVMSAPAMVVDPETPLRTAAEIMIQRGVNRLPVVDHEHLVGIVTRGDVLSAFADIR